MRIQPAAHKPASHPASAPPFLASGAGKPATLDGLKGHRRDTTPAVKALTKKLTLHPDWPFFAGAWDLPAKDVAAKLKTPEGTKKLALEALFEASGFDRGADRSYWGTDRLKLSSIKDPSAAAFLARTVEEQAGKELTPAQKKAIDANTRELAQSALASPHTNLYAAHWTNQDDSDWYGVVAVNAKTGQVRVVGWYPEP